MICRKQILNQRLDCVSIGLFIEFAFKTFTQFNCLRGDFVVPHFVGVCPVCVSWVFEAKEKKNMKRNGFNCDDNNCQFSSITPHRCRARSL